MRWCTLLLLALIACGWAASQWPTVPELQSNNEIQWRRTAVGWERYPFAPAQRQPKVVIFHPLLLAGLELLGLAALYCFPFTSRQAPSLVLRT